MPHSKKAPLPPDKVMVAFQRIRASRDGGGCKVPCPVCDAPNLDIIDQSSRPYAEWYQLTCSACGLDATLNIPLGRPASAN